MLIIGTLFACTLVAMLMNFMSLHCANRTRRDSMTTINRKGYFNLLYVYGCFMNQGTNPFTMNWCMKILQIFTPLMSSKALAASAEVDLCNSPMSRCSKTQQLEHDY